MFNRRSVFGSTIAAALTALVGKQAVEAAPEPVFTRTSDLYQSYDPFTGTIEVADASGIRVGHTIRISGDDPWLAYTITSIQPAVG